MNTLLENLARWVCRERDLPTSEMRRARLLAAMVMALVPPTAIVVVAGLAGLALEGTVLSIALNYGLALSAVLPLPLVVGRLTRPLLGGALLAIVQFVLAVTIIVHHGVGHVSSVVFAISALTATTLLNVWWAIAITAASVVSYVLLGLRQLGGQIPSAVPPTSTLPLDAIGLLLSTGIVVTFHLVYAQWTDSVLQRERRLRAELRQARDSLEERVAQRTQALAESEARYRLLAENATDMIVRLNSDGDISYLSNACQSMLGYDPETLVGADPLDWSHPDDRAAMQQAYRDVARGQASTGPFVARLRRADGTYLWTESRYRAIADPTTGMLDHVVAVTRDVTREHELQEMLRQHAVSRAVGQLAGGMAHHYNNLAQVILGHSELLLDDPSLTDAMREDLENIRAAGQGAADLTAKLLAYAQQQRLLPRATPIGPLLSDQIAPLEAILGPDVNVSLDADPQTVAYVDPEQLGRVLANLAMNAAEAMPDGGAFSVRAERVRIEGTEDASPQPAPGMYVRITVHDTGKGIAEEVQDRLFQPFGAMDNLAESEGLGLAVVYGVVRQSGGDILIESEPGQGTTVQLLLPASLDQIHVDELDQEGT